MSDVNPRRQDQGPPPSPDARSGGLPPAAVVAIVAALVVLLGVSAVVLLAGDEDPAASRSLTASPVPPATSAPTAPPTSTPATPSPDPASSPTAPTTPEATADPAPTSTAAAPREPTDADAAAFAADFRPGGTQAGAEQIESVAADTDGDGREEVVFASLVGGFAQVDIARWDGHAYQVVFTAQGGSGEVLDDLRVADYTGDGRREVVTRQSTGGGGQSLSVYGWDGQAYAPQAGEGGCWDGSATFGVLGATIEPGQITATCDDPDLPLAAQPSDVYRWDGRAWVFSHREGGR